MRALELSPEAVDDLRSIARYSDRVWGRQRRQDYMATLVGAIARLRVLEIGRSRPDIDPYAWSYRSGRHVILFERTEVLVRILRVTHERRDLLSVMSEGVREGDEAVFVR